MKAMHKTILKVNEFPSVKEDQFRETNKFLNNEGAINDVWRKVSLSPFKITKLEKKFKISSIMIAKFEPSYFMNLTTNFPSGVTV